MVIQITVQTRNKNCKLDLDLRVAKLCGLVHGMVQTTNSFEGGVDTQVNVDLPFDVCQKTLNHLEEYLAFHSSYNADKYMAYKSPAKTHLTDVKFWENDKISAWDHHFFDDLNVEMLRDLYNLGDFLDLTALTDICAYTINRKYLRPLLNKYPVDEEAIRKLQRTLRGENPEAEDEELSTRLSALEFKSQYVWAQQDDFVNSCK